MPFIGLFLLLSSMACAYHANRTGRPQFWIWVILALPGPGMLAYLLFEIVPELFAGPGGRKARAKLQTIVDPKKDLRAATEEALRTDSIANQVALAEECLRVGRPADAIALYETALKGVHATAPDLLLGLARARFAREDWVETQQTLEALQQANPGYRSPEGHLLYARALEHQGKYDAALYEYAALAEYYPGQEARCRWAELLLKRGERERARAVYEEVVQGYELAPRELRKIQRDWYALARRRLAE